MEKDDEVKGSGNHYSTYWRQYDPRIGRWLSYEPKPVAWESGYAAFRNNPIYYADPNGDWVKGAGLLKNLFNSDAKINAKAQAKATGGKAFKDGNGWTVNYKTEGPDLGNGAKTLPTSNVEHYANKPGQLTNFSSWWKNAELYGNLTTQVTYGAQAGIDVKVLGLKASLYGNMTSETWLKFSAEQRGNDTNPWDINFEYLEDDDTKTLSEGFSAGFYGGYEYKKEYESTWKGENKGNLTKGVTSHTINAIVANVSRSTHNETGVVTHDGNFTIGAKVAALIGLEINFTFGVKDKE